MDYGYNFIIDSCCDLPAEIVDREGVHLVKFPYFDSEGEHLDDLFQSITAKEFYDGMRNGETPKTAQLSMTHLREAFEWAHDQGKPAIFLAFTSGLSGTFDTATLLLEQMSSEYEDLDIRLVDTKLASVAEALLVYEALRQRDRGLTVDELVEWVQEARFFVNEEFMIDDLEALRRGGRIPASIAIAGSKLDVKPLLGIDNDGKLILTGVARGRKKGIKALFDYYQKRADSETGGQVIIVGNADCPKDASRLVELIRKHNSTAIVIEAQIGPVIGSHVGPDMLAIVFWGQDIRKEVSVADRIANKVRNK